MFEPVWIPPGAPPRFPDPRLADADGLVAFGGDLSVARLLAAYRSGVFPWFDENTPPLWWSPDPRAVLTPATLHVPRRLERTIRRGGFEVTLDRAFRRVMEACSVGRSDGTWILPEMVDAYEAVHRAGHAHSVEVWIDGELSGGIYGVRVGGLFAAESKFHTRTDMSKVALVALARSFFAAGGQLIDVQFRTPHLARLGVVEVPRLEYLARVGEIADLAVRFGTEGVPVSASRDGPLA